MKAWLSQNGVSYDARLLTDPANRSEAAAFGTGASPLTVIGGKAHWGFDRKGLTAALEWAGLSTTGVQAKRESKVRLAARAPIAEAIAVTNFLDDTVTLLHAPTGRYLGESLETSGIAVPGNPIVVEATPFGTAVVVSYEAGTMTWLSLRDAGYLHGSLEASTVATGAMPLYALAHPKEPLVYVTNSESRSITLFDARTGGYARGSLERSQFAVPGQPGIAALDAARGVLFVRLREGAVVLYDAITMQPARGTLEASTIKIGRGRGVALSHDKRILYVPEALGAADGLALYDAHSGQLLFGTRERSVLPTAPTPFAIAAHPSRSIVYVSCFGNQIIEYRDGATGAHLRGTAEASSVKVGSGARAMLVDPRHEVLYVSCYDEGAVYMFDALTGATRSVIKVGRGPRGMALLG
ncbi:MAG: hypothetical protein HY261_04360 [Chloroflexi bacterium]|nr:hypothetical protein [Chloroflexota bacterium]